MKKTFLLSAFAAVLCFYSCSNDDDEIDLPNDNHVETKLVAERLSMNEPSISNPTLHDDWENVKVIYLNNSRPGQYVDAPWTNLEGNSIDIPLSYRMDIKKEDGWSMLTHNIMDIDYSGPNYILLYNKKRGELKGFYYNPSYEKNKSCVWVMEVQNGGVTSVFKSNTDLNSVMNSKFKYMTTSNIIEDDTFSFGQLNPGWNAFSFELVYGTENNAPIVKIYGYFDEQNEIKMAGKYSGEVAIPITKTDPSGASVLLSKMKNIFKKIPGLSSLDGVLSASGTALGNTSVFKSKTSVSYIRATSSGTIELSGISKNPGRGTIPSINNIDLKKANNNEQLGLWNFAKKPSFEYPKYIWVDPDFSQPENYEYISLYQNFDNSITINPDVKNMIKSVRVCNYEFYSKRGYGSYKYTELIPNYRYYITFRYRYSPLYQDPIMHEDNPRDAYVLSPWIMSSELVNVTLEFTYNDGSTFLSSRNYDSTFGAFNNEDLITKLEQMGYRVFIQH